MSLIVSSRILVCSTRHRRTETGDFAEGATDSEIGGATDATILEPIPQHVDPIHMSARLSKVTIDLPFSSLTRSGGSDKWNDWTAS